MLNDAAAWGLSARVALEQGNVQQAQLHYDHARLLRRQSRADAGLAVDAENHWEEAIPPLGEFFAAMDEHR